MSTAKFSFDRLPEKAQACARDLATAKAVIFDVDSTVIAEEGIDVLAAHLGVGDKVAELTASAMGGDVPFEKALAERLAIMQPSKGDVEACLAQHPPTKALNPGLEDLLEVLRGGGSVRVCVVSRSSFDHIELLVQLGLTPSSLLLSPIHALSLFLSLSALRSPVSSRPQNSDIYLVSGGFRQMIYPLADHLGIPRENVFANNLLFVEGGDDDGCFAGFDEDEPTSRCECADVAVSPLLSSSLLFSPLLSPPQCPNRQPAANLAHFA